MSSESEILDRLRHSPHPASSGLRLGIGDDCAIYQPAPGQELLFTTDLLIENVHFRRDTHGPPDIGYKALARGLSDLAAMSANPRFCLLSLALPPWADQRFTDSLFGGLLRLAEETGCPLAGGDLAASPLLICDIVACGSAPLGKSLRRSGAKVGDSIWVSGRLGGSVLGLHTRRGAAWRKHLRPQPRLALGRFLRGKASAAMDLSDGLSLDLARLCQESGVAAEIGAPPVFRGATIEQALHGGEDYELLFTVPSRRKIPAAFESLPLTRIGRIIDGPPGEVRLDGALLPALGYDHFNPSSSSPAKSQYPAQPLAKHRFRGQQAHH
jgi:thiamine-monophosphate kinase